MPRLKSAANGLFSNDLLQGFENVRYGIVTGATGRQNLSFFLAGAGNYQFFKPPGGNVFGALMGGYTAVVFGVSDNMARDITNAGFQWGDNRGDSKNILWGWGYEKTVY